ncbi:Kelch repeat-containing protein [[Eubacterium] cellulosolvens]
MSEIIIIILLFSGLFYSFILNPQVPTVEAHSEWNQTSDKEFDNGTSDNLTIVGKDANAELQIDLSDLQPWIDKKPVIKPLNRYGHAMAAIDGTDKVVLFGGYTNSGGFFRLNDTWIYDYSDNTWTQKSPSNSPQSRMDSSMATIYGYDKVVLFGGSWDWNGQYDDTWVYDLSDDTWIELNPMTKPEARQLHAMAGISNDDKAILFGGYAFTGMSPAYFSDTWVFDYSTGTWAQRSPSNVPEGRYDPNMASIDGDDKVVLYGGMHPGGIDNYTWIFDLSMDNWIKKTTAKSPGYRFQHAMASIDGTDKIMLFGGHYISYNNDTWVYDLSDNRWEKGKSKKQPNIRDGLAMAPIIGTDEIVLFGGWYYTGGVPFNMIFYDDTWMFKSYLPTRNGTYISPPYDTGSNSSFISIKGFTQIPKFTSIKSQLRTAATKVGLEKKQFVGPEGTANTYYNSSSGAIWPGHNGDRWVQCIVYFNMSVYSESPCLKDLTVKYNCLPSTDPVDPINGIILTNSKPVFVWTFRDFDSEKQNGFQILIDDDINFENISFNSGEQSTAEQQWEFPTGTNFTQIPDGTWYWKVRTRDIDGNWTKYTDPWSFTIDSRSPTSVTAYPINNYKYNDLKVISGIANDGKTGSGVKNVEIKIKNLNKNKFWNGNSWVSILSWVLVSGTINWSYDTSAIDWESGLQYSIQSKALDNAGNVEQPVLDFLFHIDKNTPTSTINVPINNKWINDLPQIKGTARDTGGAGISRVELNIKCIKDNKLWDIKEENNYWSGTGWGQVKTWLPAIGKDQWFFNSSGINWTSGNQYLIQSRAVDETGNIESLNGGTAFLFDSEPPDERFVYINNGEEYTNSNKVVLSLQAMDSGSGVAEMAFSNDDIIWSSWEPFNSTKSFEVKTGDGEKIVFFKVRDYAGNIAKQVHDTIILDTIPPEQLAIIINKGAQYTNSNLLEFDLYAIDGTSGLGEMIFSFDSVNWLTWQPFKNSKSLSTQEADGEIKVYFKVRDKAGNSANYIFDTIILDTTEPHSLSITINHGAQKTKDALVTLDLNAQDNLSGVELMSFSSDGLNWSEWEKFQNSKYYNLLPDEGSKIVYFRVKDRAGNEAIAVQSTIILETPETSTGKSQTEAAANNMQIWYFSFLIILVILALIIVGLATLIKRKKRVYQELLTTGTLPKHLKHLVPTETAEQIPAATQPAQLPSAESPTPVPALAKSTQPPVDAGQQEPAATPELPALPPGPIGAQEPTTEINGSTIGSTGTEAAGTISTIPSAQPTVITPAVTQPTEIPAPTVHLPEAVSSTTLAAKTLQNINGDEKSEQKKNNVISDE